MKVTSNVRSIAIAAVLPCVVAFTSTAAAAPPYLIYDIGVVQVGDDASQGFGVSRAGIAVGRSLRTGGSQAFNWTLYYGIVCLPHLPCRSLAGFHNANDCRDVGRTAPTPP